MIFKFQSPICKSKKFNTNLNRLGHVMNHPHNSIITQLHIIINHIFHDHINQPCAGLGCVEKEFPWKPHRIQFCASINNYPQSVDRLYFSHIINCISPIVSNVFLPTVCTSPVQSWILERPQQLSTECWSDSRGVRLNCDYIDAGDRGILLLLVLF